MAFFEEFKRNASGVADKAVKKTNEITGIAKLQMSVKSKETKLAAVYEDIGRLFYNAERSGIDCTAEIANCIMKADKIKAEIASAKAEIAKLRNVVICEGCGNEIANTAAFCSFCGMKQIKPEPEVPAEEICECEEDGACCCEETCECECTCEEGCECDGNCECECDCEEKADCCCEDKTDAE